MKKIINFIKWVFLEEKRRPPQIYEARLPEGLLEYVRGLTQQKEMKKTNWEDYINERIDFLTDHWTINDRESFTFGGWRGEVVGGMADKIHAEVNRVLDSLRMSEEKYDDRDGKFGYVTPRFRSATRGGYNQAVKGLNAKIEKLREEYK